MTKQELHQKLRELILGHLKSKGWPTVQEADALVFNELPYIWQKIEQAGLVPKGCNFAIFRQIAVVKYQEKIIRQKMMDHMRGFR